MLVFLSLRGSTGLAFGQPEDKLRGEAISMRVARRNEIASPRIGAQARCPGVAMKGRATVYGLDVEGSRSAESTPNRWAVTQTQRGRGDKKLVCLTAYTA